MNWCKCFHTKTYTVHICIYVYTGLYITYVQITYNTAVSSKYFTSETVTSRRSPVWTDPGVAVLLPLNSCIFVEAIVSFFFFDWSGSLTAESTTWCHETVKMWCSEMMRVTEHIPEENTVVTLTPSTFWNIQHGRTLTPSGETQNKHRSTCDKVQLLPLFGHFPWRLFKTWTRDSAIERFLYRNLFTGSRENDRGPYGSPPSLSEWKWKNSASRWCVDHIKLKAH